AAFFLPAPYAAVTAGLGTAMADVLLSYTLYAPATFVIKALMALCAGALARGKLGRVVAAILAECIMVGGYFLFETVLYGVAGAVPALAGNSVQGIVGAVAALLLFHCLNPILNRKEK
ncbi:MAG: ECF transporter S component, partial [Oscillospiraceae bacterium]|nr:ECF transporter S component [Oscillospiraceae bacterium]